MDDTYMNECGCIPIKLSMDTDLNFIYFTCVMK